MDKLTAINFITSIAALRISITLPTSRDVLSIPTSELIYSSVCVQKVTLESMNFVQFKCVDFMWCRYNQPGPCIMQFHLQVNTLIELVLWLSAMCNKQFTKWKLLLARVIVCGCIYQLTTTDFVTSIQALRISVTFSTCRNALSIGAFELVWCTICLYEIIALVAFHNDQNLLAMSN